MSTPLIHKQYETSQFLSPGMTGITVLACFLLYLAYSAIKDIYFHPLSHIPGPKTWIAFPLLRHISALSGTSDERIRIYHNRYGDVVRWGPRDVTFISVQAWKDIYGHGHPELPKAFSDSGVNPSKIVSVNAQDYFRFRRAMLPAFSDKALKNQEPLITNYVELLVEKLKRKAQSGEATDMVLWYNLTTFDLIGDLTFGESFDGLKELKSHIWIKSFNLILKGMVVRSVLRSYPNFHKLVRYFSPARVPKVHSDHFERTERLVQKRLENEKQHGRGDFMDSFIRSRGQKHGLSDHELASNADVLLVAGSETTATLLSGVTYWLLRTPDALMKATGEVRIAFNDEKQITFTNASTRLPYMVACLDEALRLYPPVPGALMRRTNPGPPTNIAGHLIPENVSLTTICCSPTKSSKTAVGVHHTAAYWSPSNFHNPESFIPERWLPSHTSDPTSPFYSDNREVHKPFSFGPRDCIGRNLAYHEMKLILARVLWNFDLALCEESVGWNKQKVFALWKKGPLMCRLKIRTDARDDEKVGMQ